VAPRPTLRLLIPSRAVGARFDLPRLSMAETRNIPADRSSVAYRRGLRALGLSHFFTA
jgi:hypothetical protein